MKSLSVIELSELYNINRQTVYKRIKKGDLSKNTDGKIDLSEAIRVFGEPVNYKQKSVAELEFSRVQEYTEVDMLKQQVDILKKQLDLAQERENFQRGQLQVKDEQIYAMQFLLSKPKEESKKSEVEEIKPSVSSESILQTEVNVSNNKKGFWKRIFN